MGATGRHLLNEYDHNRHRRNHIRSIRTSLPQRIQRPRHEYTRRITVAGDYKLHNFMDMNTPDTEWEKTVRSKVRSAMYLAECHELQYQAVEPVVFELLTSRDTYWKERVENVLCDVEEHASQQDSDEEIGGMLRAVEIIRNHLDINANR